MQALQVNTFDEFMVPTAQLELIKGIVTQVLLLVTKAYPLLQVEQVKTF